MFYKIDIHTFFIKYITIMNKERIIIIISYKDFYNNYIL